MEIDVEQSYSFGARWIFSMLGSPLENHWINVANNRVESVSDKPAHVSKQFFGDDSIILPAVINAHTHLELSQLESAPLDVSSRSMSDWVMALLVFRRSSAYNAAYGIQQAVRRPELLKSTAAVADIVPPTLPVVDWDISPVKWLPFAELIAWRNELVDKKLTEISHVFGLSPHAPHTVCQTLLEKTVNKKKPIAMHLAETMEELQLLRHHTGPLLVMMRHADSDYDPKSVLMGKRPMDYLQLLSAAPQAFIIHGNYLDDEELQFLAAHRETMSVVYCPRSHTYFRHTPYPLQKMLDYGVRVLLGTDSLASVPDLSLVEEMQFVLKRHSTVSADIVYRMGTWDGAAALGLIQDKFGTIQSGSPARFAVFHSVKHPPLNVT